jgi:hypothetical protein
MTAQGTCITWRSTGHGTPISTPTSTPTIIHAHTQDIKNDATTIPPTPAFPQPPNPSPPSNENGKPVEKPRNKHPSEPTPAAGYNVRASIHDTHTTTHTINPTRTLQSRRPTHLPTYLLNPPPSIHPSIHPSIPFANPCLAWDAAGTEGQSHSTAQHRRAEQSRE